MAHKIVNRRIVIYDEQLFSERRRVSRHRCGPFLFGRGLRVVPEWRALRDRAA